MRLVVRAKLYARMFVPLLAELFASLIHTSFCPNFYLFLVRPQFLLQNTCSHDRFKLSKLKLLPALKQGEGSRGRTQLVS